MESDFTISATVHIPGMGRKNVSLRLDSSVTLKQATEVLEWEATRIALAHKRNHHVGAKLITTAS